MINLRNFIIGIVVLIGVGGGSAFSADGINNLHGTVASVSDGDTIRFRRNGGVDSFELADSVDGSDSSPVRMIGMDAPETHLPTTSGIVGQGEYGENATNYLSRLLPSNPAIALESHGLDKYGRILGRILYKNQDVNLMMVRAGQAVTYFLCDEGECGDDFMESQHIRPYVQACIEAKAAGRGIWDRAMPLTELPFEFRLRMQNRKADKWVGNLDTGKLFAPADYKKVPVCSRIFFKTQAIANRLGFRR